MKTQYKLAALASVVLLVAFGVLYSGKSVNASPSGQITGTVKLDGQAPKQKVIDMSKEPSCAQIHAGSPVTTEAVIAGANGGLKNVVVYISEGLSPADAAQVPAQSNQINQKGCQYLPHVVAVDTNQKVEVVNSDSTSHNIHPMPKPGGPNHEWNKSQPPGAPPFQEAFGTEEVAIPVKCNVHPWMRGYIAVVKGPYGVSDGDGNFTISNVSPGNYTLTAWQETYGTQTQKVTVAAGKPTAVNFVFKAK
jgi:plastocyanin